MRPCGRIMILSPECDHEVARSDVAGHVEAHCGVRRVVVIDDGLRLLVCDGGVGTIVLGDGVGGRPAIDGLVNQVSYFLLLRLDGDGVAQD